MSKRVSPSEGRLVTLVGSDPDFLYFTTPSWSREGVEFDITIDKRTGEVRCTCEDAQCRKKRPDLLELLKPDHQEEVCKHVRGLLLAYGGLLGG